MNQEPLFIDNIFQRSEKPLMFKKRIEKYERRGYLRIDREMKEKRSIYVDAK